MHFSIDRTVHTTAFDKPVPKYDFRFLHFKVNVGLHAIYWYTSCVDCNAAYYTLFHEIFSTFFFNKISLPERRNKRKSVLEITKMYYFKI